MTKDTTKNERLQRVWRLFEESHDKAPASAREVVAWGVAQGLLYPPTIDPLDVLAGDMARALREQYATDEQGRRYRVNHAVRVTRGSVQHTMWGMLGEVGRPFMEQAFYQRREQIVGDCVQLRVDVDVFNDKNAEEEPIPLVLDFTDDVEERLMDDDDDDEKKAA